MITVPADYVSVSSSKTFSTRGTRESVETFLATTSVGQTKKRIEAVRSDRDLSLIDEDDADYRSHNDEEAKTLSHPLLKAAYLAFANHLPLVLGPDVLWQCVLQGVSRHVNAFVDTGKGNAVTGTAEQVELRIRNDTLVMTKGGDTSPSMTNEWEATIPQFAEHIRGHVTKNGNIALADALHTRFSTTTSSARMAHVVSFMSALKHFFAYTVVTMCGIPSVHLRGSREDWQHLSDAIGAVLDAFPQSASDKNDKRQLDLDSWKICLQALVSRIIETIDATQEDRRNDVVMRRFWTGVFKKEGGKSSGRMLNITGWLSLFVGYLNNGRPNPLVSTHGTGVYASSSFHESRVKEERATSETEMVDMELGRKIGDWKRREKERDVSLLTDMEYVKYNLMAEDDPSASARCTSGGSHSSDSDDDGIEPCDFPSAICETPFKWEYKYKDYPMGLYGGLIGIHQHPDTLALEPVLGWAVAHVCFQKPL